MAWIEIVTVVTLLQYIVFGAMVGRARGKYGVSAPAVTGHEMFERYYRVQMNTLELLVVFLPALWLAAHHWSPVIMAAIGMVFVVGRVIYLRSYTTDPASRGLGFGLSIGPTVILLIAGLIGALMAVTS